MVVPSFLRGRSEEEANLIFKARKEKGKSVFERGSQHISLVQNAPTPLEFPFGYSFPSGGYFFLIY